MTSTEEDIEALKRMLESLGNMDTGKGGAEIDTSAIMMKINLLSEELKKKADRTEVEKTLIDSKKYTDKESTMLNKKINEGLDGLRFEIERLRAEFEQHKSKDF